MPADAAAPWRHVDVFLVAITMSLAGMGLLLIYSATQHKEDVGDISADRLPQAAGAVGGVGVVVMAVSGGDRLPGAPRLLAGAVRRHVLVLLPVLSPLGTNTGRAGLVPVRLLPAPAVGVRQARVHPLPGLVLRGPSGDLDFRRLVTVLSVASVPVALIYRQPDLGTDLVFVAILMAMLLVGGAQARHIVVLTSSASSASWPSSSSACSKEYQHRPAERLPRAQGRHASAGVQPRPVGERHRRAAG